MSLYRYKGSKVWTMDFIFDGQRIRESTGTRSKTLAGDIERKRRRQLEEGAVGLKSKRNRPLLFSIAAEDYFKMKEPRWEEKTRLIAETTWPICSRSSANICWSILKPRTSAHIKRLGWPQVQGRGPCSLFRAIMRRFGAWARIQHEVSMLPEQGDIGRKISAEEEALLLRECSNSRSRGLFPFVTLAIETGARKNVIRTLQWKWINLNNACIQFGKDKTPSGTGRIIPLNRRALETVKLWAQRFPNRQPEHYVFPAERYGASGDVFEATAYATDPTKPLASIKEAWERAKKRAGVTCRFHDLKHTAVSRMLDAGVPIAKIAKIVGWSPATMVRMSARYGHFGLEDLRAAVETISRPAESKIDQMSPVNPPGITKFPDAKVN